VNYYAARQLGPNSRAPGKWNWTRMNDGVITTAAPCYQPDGGDDHDSKEDAERHFWEWEAANLRRTEYTTASRCDGPHDGDAPRTAIAFGVRPVGAEVHVCPQHESQAVEIWKAAHPFVPGIAVTSSW